VALQSETLVLTWGQLAQTVAHLKEALPRLDRDPGLLAREFVWFAHRPAPRLTGYYGAEIEASLVPHPDYPWPILTRPADLQRLDLGEFHPKWQGEVLRYRMADGRPWPYHDRAAIDDGALADRGLEIAWAKDRYDLYHLQVQGAGVLRLPDDSTTYILYAGKNGRAFRPISRALMDRGLIERGKVHRPGIKEALACLPEATREEVFRACESYVFFRLSDEPPHGAINRPLTPFVSLAVDPSMVPLGAVLPFRLTLPDPEAGEGAKRTITGIGLAQDVGGAIKGRRMDFYCGVGDEREKLAWSINTPFTVSMLVSKRALPGESAQ
jgi:membrane-bound lytic murein transglycosylase A